LHCLGPVSVFSDTGHGLMNEEPQFLYTQTRSKPKTQIIFFLIRMHAKDTYVHALDPFVMPNHPPTKLHFNKLKLTNLEKGVQNHRTTLRQVDLFRIANTFKNRKMRKNHNARHAQTCVHARVQPARLINLHLPDENKAHTSTHSKTLAGTADESHPLTGKIRNSRPVGTQQNSQGRWLWWDGCSGRGPTCRPGST